MTTAPELTSGAVVTRGKNMSHGLRFASQAVGQRASRLHEDNHLEFYTGLSFWASVKSAVQWAEIARLGVRCQYLAASSEWVG